MSRCRNLIEDALKWLHIVGAPAAADPMGSKMAWP